MQAITAAGSEECGSSGDYLAWQDMVWDLHGGAKLVEIDRTEPCTREVDIAAYTEFLGAKAPL